MSTSPRCAVCEQVRPIAAHGPNRVCARCLAEQPDPTSPELVYEELIRQPYRDCAFSAGYVHNHAVDSLYLRLQRDGELPTTILLRPDEAAALAWCLTGALWAERIRLDTSGSAQP